MSRWIALTDEDREAAFNSLDDGLNGFLKKWGWLHFAKAIEERCREKNGARSALSDNPAQERNQCDGCVQGAPLRGNLHIDKDGRAFMACERDKYASALPHDNPARSAK